MPEHFETEGYGRRDVLKLALAGAAALAVPATTPARAAAVKTSARIVIAGAGAAGLAMANRLSAMLDGASITLIDGRRPHYYQPGFTLVGAGLKPASYVVSGTASYVPRGAEWLEEAVAEIDADGNRVVTASGRQVPYDFLVVATGLTLDYGAIEGMDVGLIGKDGIGSVYAGPEAAAATYAAMARFAETGGVGLFGRPAGEMKCAGAPLKYTFLTEDTLSRMGNRGSSELIYAAHNDSLFGVPIVAEKLRMLFAERGIQTAKSHVMRAIDPARRIITYDTPDGSKELGYDFAHVVPPMRAPEAVRNSALPWQTGPWAADGWVEADRATLRHPRYANVFAVGDVAGVPKGKTAASVKWQVPVVADQLVAAISGTPSDSAYNGYTSCPLITRVGRAMLIEFDYDNNLVPSFPGVIAPLEELWISWVMKETALKPTYYAMLRGKA
ncbi:NAD(P)/FAD-dependent oxidoreductase [Aquibium sp. A9E412]|uniref:NAD(P)/FAD-dependent oxidoreductase n=1 Tax=Aquibium sp. A9E412 TaxID=2976767 RepID=UPI0025B1CE4A|nr:FAD/NAD(P)-binding oxidoreductase [Aquibium sp. A9E412]MDN2568303.1 NAD(P)/FAD-dependent oxidoreductase [Aquibium sp. A9E412]